MPNLRTAAILASALLASSAFAQDLNKTLAQMDAASAKFQSAQANLSQDKFDRVVKETTMQHGVMYTQRVGGNTQMGLKITDPGEEKVVQFKDGILDVFSPGVDQIDEFKSAQAEGFLAIGFGGKGSDLARSWTIKDLGPENISVDGKTIAAEKLDLVSKDPSVRSTYFSHITLWVDLARDISLKQQFFQSSGDTTTSTYTNIRYNQKVNSAEYAIKKDKATKIIRH